jgi:FKBP-type peptidyl-prolyl cis-trans isomerase
MEANLITGFKEGLLLMEIGQKVRLFIPPHLGWGENGAGNVIPPNASVIFDIEVVSRVEE